MPRDPKYGSTSRGFEDTRRLMAEGGAVSDLEAKEKKLAQEQERVAEVETRAGRARGDNTRQRKNAIDVVDTQITRIDALASSLERETSILARNTAAWRANAGIRAEASVAARETAAASRYGATERGFADTRATILGAGGATAAQAATSDLERKAAQEQLRRDTAALAQLQTLGARAPVREPLLLPQRTGTGFIAGPGGVAETPERLTAERTVAAQRTLELASQRRAAVEQVRARPVAAAPRVPLTDFDREAIAVNQAMQASLAGVGGELERTNKLWRQSVAEVASASQATTRHGALTAEFIQSLVRGEARLKEFHRQVRWLGRRRRPGLRCVRGTQTGRRGRQVHTAGRGPA